MRNIYVASTKTMGKKKKTKYRLSNKSNAVRARKTKNLHWKNKKKKTATYLLEGDGAIVCQLPIAATWGCPFKGFRACRFPCFALIRSFEGRDFRPYRGAVNAGLVVRGLLLFLMTGSMEVTGFAERSRLLQAEREIISMSIFSSMIVFCTQCRF